MIRAFQWDLARQVERLEWLLAQLPRYADWGYQELYLHLEDAVEYPSLPGVARRDAYSHRDLGRLVDAATRAGLRVVPIANLLGHTQYLIKVPEFRDLNELRAPDGTPLATGQLCPLHPRTPEIAEKLLRDVAPFCTAGKVHVGLDESFHLGRHPLSRREVARIGLPAHFARYVGRLRALTGRLGLGMGIWADMLYFLPEALPLLPPDVAAYEWYYYGFRRRPRVEFFNFAETDLGERLRARGLAYWGCPMNGAFRYEPLPNFTDRLDNIVSWWRRGQQLKAQGLLVTSWEPYRLALELTTVVDAAAASLWLDDVQEPRAMLERGFARVFGRTKGRRTRVTEAAERRKARKAAALALACDAYPFSGYPRWEVNAGWQYVSRREPLDPYLAEQRHFSALVRQVAGDRSLPEPLRASIDLRFALAMRDVWLRIVAQHHGGRVDRAFASPLLAAVQLGLGAARRMWRRTRDRAVASPNEQILLADRERLRAALRGRLVFGPDWQLCYRVENIRPAAQFVGVEQQRADGTWELIQGCHTIEFLTRAARRTGGLTREHAAPVAWDGAGRPPPLRFVLRGVGKVRIRDITLAGGATWYDSPDRTLLLGTDAPSRGFPVIRGATDQLTAAVRLQPLPTTASRHPRTGRESGR